MNNEKRAELVNALIEAGGRVVFQYSDRPSDVLECIYGKVCGSHFKGNTFYLLEDGETPQKFQRPL